MEREKIRLDHISKKFRNDIVLKDISATLRQGEVLGFTIYANKKIHMVVST